MFGSNESRYIKQRNASDRAEADNFKKWEEEVLHKGPIIISSAVVMDNSVTGSFTVWVQNVVTGESASSPSSQGAPTFEDLGLPPLRGTLIYGSPTRLHPHRPSQYDKDREAYYQKLQNLSDLKGKVVAGMEDRLLVHSGHFLGGSNPNDVIKKRLKEAVLHVFGVSSAAPHSGGSSSRPGSGKIGPVEAFRNTILPPKGVSVHGWGRTREVRIDLGASPRAQRYGNQLAKDLASKRGGKK